MQTQGSMKVFLMSLTLAACGAAGDPEPLNANGDSSMTKEQQVAQLRTLITSQRTVEAEALARVLGPDAAPALLPLAEHKSVDVRLAVLEVATAVLRGPDLCRLALKLVFDADESVSGLAGNYLGACSTPALLGDLLAAMQRNQSPALGAVLALQVGRVGTSAETSPLQDFRSNTRDPEYRHALGTALAKLGDRAARRELADNLASGLLEVRLQALRDIEYVGDPRFVSRFGNVLDDPRDAVPLSLPGEPPVSARVCDVAVLTMLRLGVKLSYQFDQAVRLEDKHLDEARQYVKTSAPLQL